MYLIIINNFFLNSGTDGKTSISKKLNIDNKKFCHLNRVLHMAKFTFFNMPSLMNSRPGVSNLGADLSKHF